LRPFSLDRLSPDSGVARLHAPMGPDEGTRPVKFVGCDGLVIYGKTEPMHQNIENLKQAASEVAAEDVFMSST
jgi:hypothetical protein